MCYWVFGLHFICKNYGSYRKCFVVSYVLYVCSLMQKKSNITMRIPRDDQQWYCCHCLHTSAIPIKLMGLYIIVLCTDECVCLCIICFSIRIQRKLLLGFAQKQCIGGMECVEQPPPSCGFFFSSRFPSSLAIFTASLDLNAHMLLLCHAT